MKYNRISRRLFLQGTGGAFLSLPFLTSLVPLEARAAGSVARRYVYFFRDFDTGRNATWLPNPTSSGAAVAQPRLNSNGVLYQSLKEFASGSSSLAPLYGNSLNGVLDSVNLVRGLDMLNRYGHGNGFANGYGIAASNSVPPGISTFDSTIMPLLNPFKKMLICGPMQGNDRVTSFENGAPSAMIGDLGSLYQRVFSGVNESSGGGTGGGGGVVTPAHPRRDIMSLVLEDYNRTLNSKNISSEDKVQLKTVGDLFADIHRRLPAGGTVDPGPVIGSCSFKHLSGSGGGFFDPVGDKNFCNTLINIITAAFMCDAARVFSFSFINSFFNSGNNHALSHDPANWQLAADQQKNLLINLVAPLAQRLNSIIDPANNKSYLYNSILHTTFESNEAHGWANHPTILIGNAAGNISSGNYVDFSNPAKGKISSKDGFGNNGSDFNLNEQYYGVSYNRIFVTLAQALGLTSGQYERPGINSIYGQPAAGGFGYLSPSTQFGDLAKYDVSQFKNLLQFPPGFK